MTREEFFKKIGLIGLLPISRESLAAIASESVSNKALLLSTYVAGVYYYSINDVADRIKPNQNLRLKREPENKYDHLAIEVYYESKKIGYLPRAENKILANLMDQGKVLTATVSQIFDQDDNYTELAVNVYLDH